MDWNESFPSLRATVLPGYPARSTRLCVSLVAYPERKVSLLVDIRVSQFCLTARPVVYISQEIKLWDFRMGYHIQVLGISRMKDFGAVYMYIHVHKNAPFCFTRGRSVLLI